MTQPPFHHLRLFMLPSVPGRAGSTGTSIFNLQPRLCQYTKRAAATGALVHVASQAAVGSTRFCPDDNGN